MTRGEGLARLAVIALVLVVPAAYVPRVLGERPAPLGVEPKHADLIVVTTATWPTAEERGNRVFDDLRLAASRIDASYAAAASTAGAAASLWTGRFPANHGVRTDADALPHGAWTIATAARDGGARTAAFLTAPLVSATGIGGFDEVVEDPSLTASELLRHATRVLEGADPDERSCLWLHVAPEDGSSLEPLAAVLDGLREHLAASTRRFTTLLIATGFGQSSSVHPDGRWRAPLWVLLPAGRAAGLEGAGAVSQVDVAGAVCELLALPRPAGSQAPLQSRGEALWANVNGAGGFEWLFLPGEHGDVLRFGRTRVAPDGAGGLVARSTETPAFDARFDPVSAELAATLREQYRVLRARIAAGATEPAAAEVPEAFSDTDW